jgi:hypothetical protein
MKSQMYTGTIDTVFGLHIQCLPSYSVYRTCGRSVYLFVPHGMPTPTWIRTLMIYIYIELSAPDAPHRNSGFITDPYQLIYDKVCIHLLSSLIYDKVCIHLLSSLLKHLIMHSYLALSPTHMFVYCCQILNII